MNRRHLLRGAVGATASLALGATLPSTGWAAPALLPSRGGRLAAGQRVVVLMCDGLGPDYIAKSEMPTLKRWMKNGLYRKGLGIMPTVTNANNAGICCGAWPSEHGITGNSYLDTTSGVEAYMEDPALLLAPTMFERAGKLGVRSALLSAKKKTVKLLSRGAEIALTAEEPTDVFVQRYGKAPDIYSREINYWLMTVAIDLLKTRPELGCVYIHTTDYPMHTWPAEAPESREHLAKLDALLAELEQAAPDAAFFLTADHGLNHKTRAWDLDQACRNRGAPLRMSISAERDKYPKHHRGLGGVAWVYLNDPKDRDTVMRVLGSMDGIEEVLTRSEAASQFKLLPARIGDLVVTGDKDTVFGKLELEMEKLEATYRTHGSRYEQAVPLLIYNAKGTLPDPESLQYNLDVTRRLFRA